MIDLEQNRAIALYDDWIIWIHASLHSRHISPGLQVFQDRGNRRLFIAAHQVTRAGNDFDAPGPLLLLNERFEFIQWANLVKFACDEQFGAFKGLRKAICRAKKRQANGHNCAYTWIERGIEQGDICSKAVADHAHFGRVSPRLSQYSNDGPCQVKWFQASIGLLSLAVTHSPEVKPQSYHSRFGQSLSQCERQRVMHIAAGRLGMAQNNQRGMLRL